MIERTHSVEKTAALMIPNLSRQIRCQGTRERILENTHSRNIPVLYTVHCVLCRTHFIENTFYREHILKRTHSKENTF